MQKFFIRNKKGIIGTTIFHVAIAVIILFLGFSTPLPLPGEEAIIINFGTDDEGLGFTRPRRQETAPPTPSPPPVSEQETEEQIITQDIEDAPALPAPQEEEVTQPEPAPPVERPQPEPVEEVINEEPPEEVPERRPNPNALFPGRTATGETGEGEGETTGSGDQGRETGSPDSPHRTGGDTGSPDGISYSLDGRNPLALPLPDYNYQVEGIVVVEVTVNRNGEVTNAIPGVRGSTTLNDYLLNTAKRAAERARFNIKPDAPAFQKGTITYHFRLQ
ncbi:MAG: TonB family protein [Bacteroidales bacterium]